MEPLVNACAMLSPGDDVQGNKSAQRATEKPQQSFAIAVTVAGVKGGETPDKEAPAKTAAATIPPSEQGVSDIRRGRSRSTSDADEAIVAAGAVGQPGASPPVSQTGIVRKTDSLFTAAEGRNADAKEPARAVRSSAERGRGPKNGAVTVAENGHRLPSGSKSAAQDGGFQTLGAAAAAVKAHPAVLPGRPDQKGAKAAYAHGAPGVRLNRNVQGPRLAGQPRVRSPRDGGLGRPDAKMGPARPDMRQAGSAALQHAGGTQPEPLAPPLGRPTITVLHPAGEAQARGVAEGKSAVLDSPTRGLGEQILDSLQASMTQGPKQVTIHLQPPELGAVLVRLREHGGQLEGTLEIATTETRRQVEQALPEVVRSLQDAGIVVRRLDVVAGEPSGQELDRSLSQQDAWSASSGWGHNRDHFLASHTTRPQAATEYSTNSPQTLDTDRPMRAARGRIDVLL